MKANSWEPFTVQLEMRRPWASAAVTGTTLPSNEQPSMTLPSDARYMPLTFE